MLRQNLQRHKQTISQNCFTAASFFPKGRTFSVRRDTGEIVRVDPGLEGCTGGIECYCKVAFLRTLLNVYRLESKEREKTTELQRLKKN